MTTHDPFEDWADEVAADLVQPLDPEQVRSIAHAAASTAAIGATGVAATGAATGATAGVSVMTKAIATVALTVTLGAGAAALGVLPDPIQSWVADLVDGIGIEIPRPDDSLDLPEVTIPDVPIPGVDLDVLP